MNDSYIVYLCSDLKRVGPTRQTLNIICNANNSLRNVMVLTLFDEPVNSMKNSFVQKGIRCESLRLNRNNLLLAVVKLVAFLKKNKIRFIHSYGVKPDILLYIVSKFIHVPYVITQRCIPIEDYPVRMQKIVGTVMAKIHMFVLKRAKHVVACSKHLHDVMRSDYGFENITYVQNGVDVDFFAKKDKIKLRRILNLPEQGRIFVSTGLFLERKHNDEIIRAFEEMNDEHLFLVMLGDGPLFEFLKKKYSNCRNIVFCGLVSNVVDYLSASDCFVSASDSEGLPNAVLEALSCGCPVILSKIPQHKEILEVLPSCGMLFSLHDVENLKECMRLFCLQSTQFGNTAVKLASSPFTMKAMGMGYRRFYETHFIG